MKKITKVGIAAVILLLIATFAWAGGAGGGGGTIGPGGGGGMYNESPMLAALVESGDLPPVDERLPKEPLVKTAPEIGRYGGTASSLAWYSWHGGDLFGWSQGALTLTVTDGELGPGIARDYELSADQKTFTLFLREGMHWSDGEPFTADDYVFRYEDIGMNPDVPRGYRNEPIESLTAVDDYTVRFRFTVPNARITVSMANEDGYDWNRISPEHYLKNWHLDYNPDAQDIAEEEGFENWGQALVHHGNWNPVQDPNVPSLRPWVLREESVITRLYERNAYWWCVDAEGNQLPYIDKVQATIADDETYKLAVLNGDVTWAYKPAFEDFTLYKQNEASGDYKVLLLPGTFGGQHTYHFNQNYEEPVLGEVLRDLRFRRALSLAIDRDEMNEVLYNGMGVPRQVTVNPDVSYYKPEWGEEHPYIRYDPAAANRLLDEMGLTEKDRDGFRKLSNGQTINLPIVTYGIWNAPEGDELVKEYWEDVGIKSSLRLVEPSFFWGYRGTTEWGLFPERATGTDEFNIHRDSGRIGSPLGENWGPLWSQYLQADKEIRLGISTLDDYEGGVMPGERPSPETMEIWENLLKAGSAEFGSQEYMDGYTAAFEIFAEQMYIVGTVGLVPELRVAKNNLGNASEEWYSSGIERHGQNDAMLFFRE